MEKTIVKQRLLLRGVVEQPVAAEPGIVCHKLPGSPPGEIAPMRRSGGGGGWKNVFCWLNKFLKNQKKSSHTMLL
jgi:hypothetical protein